MIGQSGPDCKDVVYRSSRQRPRNRLSGHSHSLDESNELLALQGMEDLFISGDERGPIYRFEVGSIVISIGASASIHDDIPVANPSHFVGLGFLDQHTTSPYELARTTESCIPSSVVSEMATIHKGIQAQFSREILRDFQVRRIFMRSRHNHATPQHKLDRLLIALSSVASREGETLHSVLIILERKFIANLLVLSVAGLSDTSHTFISPEIISKYHATGVVHIDSIRLLALAYYVSQRP